VMWSVQTESNRHLQGRSLSRYPLRHARAALDAERKGLSLAKRHVSVWRLLEIGEWPRAVMSVDKRLSVHGLNQSAERFFLRCSLRRHIDFKALRDDLISFNENGSSQFHARILAQGDGVRGRLTFRDFEARCAAHPPPFSITEASLVAETAWRLAYLILLSASRVTTASGARESASIAASRSRPRFPLLRPRLRGEEMPRSNRKG
jgi:hypothetical protein